MRRRRRTTEPPLESNLTVRIDGGMREKLERAADEEELTIGAIVREALTQWLARLRGDKQSGHVCYCPRCGQPHEEKEG